MTAPLEELKTNPTGTTEEKLICSIHWLTSYTGLIFLQSLLLRINTARAL
jgi:hypothetical protein